ncbi:MAG: Chromate resistance protein ChrB, partial [Thermomicrobiales bacterium]
MDERLNEINHELQRWLLFIYRVPQSPPGRRTYVWRQLKGLGAAYLQQAAAILPDYPELRTGLKALAARVRE